jgi:hypothetical protein
MRMPEDVLRLFFVPGDIKFETLNETLRKSATLKFESNEKF